MQNVLWVGCGGFLGAVARFGVMQWTLPVTARWGFPVGTLVANLLGCLIIGFLFQLADARTVLNAQARLFLFVGILGSFTTFSTFGLETFNLLEGRAYWLTLLNIGGHLFLGLTAVWVGRRIALAVL